MGHDWHETLCGCFSNPLVCVFAWCVPAGICCVQAAAVDKLNNEGKLIPFLLVFFAGCLGGAINRETIRKGFNLDGGFMSSLCIWMFCSLCAATQEYREVYSRVN